MKTKSKSRESRSENAKFPTGIKERIRQRAYELYQQRGGVDGFALDEGSKQKVKLSERESK